MGKTAAFLTRVYYEHHLIGDVFNVAEVDIRRKAPQVDGFGEAGPRRVVGDLDFTMRANGFGDFAVDDADQQLHTGDGVADRRLLFLYGTSRGDPGYDGIVNLADQPRIHRIGEAAVINVTGEGSNQIARVLALSDGPQEAITGNGNGTGVNQGASTVTVDTIVCTMRVVAVAGSGSCDIQIQDSPNNAAWANVTDLNFTTLNAVGVTRKTTTAATDTWKRMVVSNFSGTSVTIVCTIGLVAK
jgi:hypothetical protein